MTRIDRGWMATALIAGVLTCFAAVDSAQAQRQRGGGGGGGGGGARPSAQASNAQAGQRGGTSRSAAPASSTRNTATVNNAKADSRTNNVRNTSVNNVNVERNVNVQVENGGCCHNGWDNDHPVATAAAVGATIAVTSAVIGSIVNTPPPGCAPVNYGGIVYQHCGSAWYQPQGAQYVVVAPPY